MLLDVFRRGEPLFLSTAHGAQRIHCRARLVVRHMKLGDATRRRTDARGLFELFSCLACGPSRALFGLAGAAGGSVTVCVGIDPVPLANMFHTAPTR